MVIPVSTNHPVMAIPSLQHISEPSAIHIIISFQGIDSVHHVRKAP